MESTWLGTCGICAPFVVMGVGLGLENRVERFS